MYYEIILQDGYNNTSFMYLHTFIYINGRTSKKANHVDPTTIYICGRRGYFRIFFCKQFAFTSPKFLQNSKIEPHNGVNLPVQSLEMLFGCVLLMNIQQASSMQPCITILFLTQQLRGQCINLHPPSFAAWSVCTKKIGEICSITLQRCIS